MPISLGAGALIGGAITAASALAGTAMRNEAQKRENEMAFQRERDQIREQNAYNSPSAQMARMAAAGLNPNLMYEKGEQGLQNDTAHYTPAEIASGVEPLGNVGSQVINDLIGLKDMKNKTALAEADIALKASTVDFNMSASKLNAQSVTNMVEKLGFEKRKLLAEAELTEAEVKNAQQRLNNLKADEKKALKDLQLSDAQIAKLSAEEKEILALLPSKAEFLNANAAQQRAMVEKIALEMEIAHTNKWTAWANVGINALNAGSNLLNVLGTLKKFLKNGENLGKDLVNPWDDLSGLGMNTELPGM